jgi:hypothetical protein
MVRVVLIKAASSLYMSYLMRFSLQGQFYDLLELFRVGGDVPDTNYIFMVRTYSCASSCASALAYTFT